jgi:hypothetical protein
MRSLLALGVLGTIVAMTALVLATMLAAKPPAPAIAL